MNPRRLHGRRWDCPANSPFRPGAMEVSRLLETIDETLQVRYKSEEGTRRWKNACAEFHSRYDKLAFPGGFSHAVERLEKSDPEIIDLVLRFLEDRPYFFRSQYLRSILLRRCKRASLNDGQRQRLKAVLDRQRAWEELKRQRS